MPNQKSYGSLNTWDLYKFVAIVLMTIDHIGLYLMPSEFVFRMIGRMCVPIWLFLAGYGCFSPKNNIKRRLQKDVLLAFVLISILHIFYTGGLFPLDILAAIWLGRYMLYSYGRKIDKYATYILLLFLPISYPSYDLMVYGTAGISWMILGYLAAKHPGGLRNMRLRLYGSIIFIVHAISQFIYFDFPEVYFLHFSSGLAMIFVLLMLFKPRPDMETQPAWAQIITCLSRHSLVYYISHIVLCMALAIAIYT